MGARGEAERLRSRQYCVINGAARARGVIQVVLDCAVPDPTQTRAGEPQPVFEFRVLTAITYEILVETVDFFEQFAVQREIAAEDRGSPPVGPPVERPVLQREPLVPVAAPAQQCSCQSAGRHAFQGATADALRAQFFREDLTQVHPPSAEDSLRSPVFDVRFDEIPMRYAIGIRENQVTCIGLPNRLVQNPCAAKSLVGL